MIDLSPGSQRDSQFVRLFARHEAAVRAFVRPLLPRYEDVDEVMQNASVVAWRKFGELNDAEGFGRWMCMIARFEVLKYRRSKARDRMMLDANLIALIATEAVENFDVQHARLRALDGCLRKLPEKRRELVLRCYAPGQEIKSLAAAIGKTPTALYQMLARVRQSLLTCVEKSLQQEGHHAVSE